MLDHPPKSVLAFKNTHRKMRSNPHKETIMAWTPPKLREICIGLEINGYMAGSL